MQIGILGSGDVGRALGTGFATIGHSVKIGSRNPDQEKIRQWVAKTGPNASAGMPPGGPPDMFICGEDADAKKIVTRLLHSFEWAVNDIGGIMGARYLEPLAMVWILHFAATGSGNHAFKLLRK